MEKHRSGSSLVMVMCFTCAIAIAVLGVWQSSLYIVQAAQARTAYVKMLKSTEGLLNIGVELGIENYDQLMKSTEEIVIPLPEWLMHQGNSYAGELRIQNNKDHLMLHASVKNTQKVAQAMHCKLIKKANDQFEINGWSKNGQS